LSAVNDAFCPPITGQSFVRYRLGGKGRIRYTEQPRRIPPRNVTFSSRPAFETGERSPYSVLSEIPARFARSACEVRAVPFRSSRQSSNQTAVSFRFRSRSVKSQKSFSIRKRSPAWRRQPSPSLVFVRCVRCPGGESGVPRCVVVIVRRGGCRVPSLASDSGILEFAIGAPVVIGLHSGGVRPHSERRAAKLAVRLGSSVGGRVVRRESLSSLVEPQRQVVRFPVPVLQTAKRDKPGVLPVGCQQPSRIRAEFKFRGFAEACQVQSVRVIT
jgi:hypothetical protein